MEHNLQISIPSELTIRKIIQEELKEFLNHLTIYLTAKDKPLYLTSGETAELLHISMPTLRRWTKEGILIPHRVSHSRKVLFKTEEIEKTLERKNLMKWRLAS
jgi:excisionase family DNA binding protein